MRLLFIVPHYAPDLGPSAPLFTLLAETLAGRGHEVTVLTTVPHYPTGRVQDEYRGSTQTSIENDVRIIRVALPSVKRSNLALRLLQFACYQVGAAWAGRNVDFDAALVANPALWVWLPFTWLVARRKKPAVFSIHDLYPSVGVTLGVFRNGLIVRAVASLERFCLSRSAAVRILSDSFRPGLQALGVPEDKITLIYDWVDTDLIQPLSHDNAFSRENNLTDTFVVLYAGNLGLSQGLEHVLEAAHILAEDPEIRFVFVGGGAGRDALIARTRQDRIPNVVFLPFQPRQRLAEVLACSNVSLVVLRRGVGTESLPSKTYSILASGRPILACVDEDSETAKLVKRANAGICVAPEDPGRLAEAILTFKKDPLQSTQLGCNGRVWAEQNHSPQGAAEAFEKLFFAICDSSGN